MFPVTRGVLQEFQPRTWEVKQNLAKWVAETIEEWSMLTGEIPASGSSQERYIETEGFGRSADACKSANARKSRNQGGQDHTELFNCKAKKKSGITWCSVPRFREEPSPSNRHHWKNAWLLVISPHQGATMYTPMETPLDTPSAADKTGDDLNTLLMSRQKKRINVV